MSVFHRAGALPLLYGHRGASARAPENTMRAFTLALEGGADGVELDVRLARDGAVVVCHDPELSRLADRPERVADLDMRQLSAIRVGGERIPDLDAVIDLCAARHALLNVEIKGDVPSRVDLVRRVARLLARRSPRDRRGILISSFRPEMLGLLRALHPGVPVSFLFDEANTGKTRAAVLRRALAPEGMHPHHGLADRRAIARWHARGAFVNAWTVDDPSLAARLASEGIDGIITNDPEALRAALGAR